MTFRFATFYRFAAVVILAVLAACSGTAAPSMPAETRTPPVAPAAESTPTLEAAAAGQPTPTGGETTVENQPMLVYAGSYTQGPGQDGITIFRFDPASGALTQAGSAGGIENPSFLAVDPSRRYLLAVSETGEFKGQPGGGVASYRIDPQTGALALINAQPTRGAYPAYVSVDPSGKWVLVANYGGGSVTALPLSEDGALGEPSATVLHQGKGPNANRQEAPHAHSVMAAPGNGTLVASADLGIDRVMLYDLDSSGGKLAAHDPASIQMKPGSGPRHMAFTPDGRFFYVVGELDSTVTAFSFDAAAGTFAEIETLSLLPEGYNEQNTAADIHIHPSGKFLYASNRGHNSLAAFSIDPATGQLKSLGYTSTGGVTPRNFAIDPTGQFILAANQDSGNIYTLRLDPATGGLSATGQEVRVPSPVNVLFYPMK